ncbi:MAG: molybdopterin cofactor-binding domain-containing protein [Bryobacteraceae bacterium]
MNKPKPLTSTALENEIEFERYELRGQPVYEFPLDRRDFFRGLGGGLLVIGLIGSVAAQESGGGRRAGREAMPKDMSSWLHIAEDGKISVFTGKAEVGQNTRTSLTQAVAEELRTPPDAIHLVMADTDLVPYDAGTFGSLSTPQMAPQLHKVAACAREMLLDLAAKQWSVDRASLTVRDAGVVDAGGKRRLSFGQLTHGQQLVQAIADRAAPTPVADWKICGTSVAKVDGRDFVTGRHKYTSDMSAPGMLTAKVVRPAAFGATLESVDAKAAEAMPGVSVVRDGDLLAVAAKDSATATKAAAAIHAQWKITPQTSSRELFEHLKKTAKPARTLHQAGSIDDGLAGADLKLQQTYHVAYIAHVPLEPRAALAEWTDGKLTVYTGTQRPFGVRSELAQAFHIPEDRVRVIVPDTGAGYGGKHTGEAAVEAARIAKAAGKPVKLVWTREEEFTWAYARPAGVIEVSSGVTNDGSVTAWQFHNYNSGTAGIRGQYAIPNERIEMSATDSPLRQGSYRALASTANHFARESHLDELAHALKMDPVAFRNKNLKDDRQRDVIAAAADKFGWGKSKPAPGHGFGIAGGFEKNGYVASAVEVSVDRATGKVKVVRVTTAFDCGAVVNPDHLRHQVEGAIIMGLGGALFESLEFDNGRLLNPHLRNYRVPRFSDIPVLETVLIDRKNMPSAGAGECPIVALAPAIANAIFSASGVRLRSMPLVPDGLKG